MKKFIALVLSLVMILALCACGNGRSNTVLDGSDANDPLTKDDVISIMIPSSASWPIRDDWKLW